MTFSIVEAIEEVQTGKRVTKVVAIDGYGGSGKSELADRLARRLGNATVVRADDFARPNVPGWEWARMHAQVLDPLANNRPARYQRYDWDADEPAEWHDVPVGGTLIVEGVSSMRDELGRYWDFAIWLDCPYGLRLQRGVERDGEAMRSKWTDVWMPEEDAYFNARRPDLEADVVIDSTKPYEL
jgi:uridine kinase